MWAFDGNKIHRSAAVNNENNKNSSSTKKKTEKNLTRNVSRREKNFKKRKNISLSSFSGCEWLCFLYCIFLRAGARVCIPYTMRCTLYLIYVRDRANDAHAENLAKYDENSI